MTTFTQLYQAYAPTFTAVALVLSILAFVSVVLQGWALRRRLEGHSPSVEAEARSTTLLTGLRRLAQQNSDRLAELEHDVKGLRTTVAGRVGRVGVVRFNPFQETGGDQSFSIALLDDHGNGVVITSLYTRDGTRIYAKPLEQGQSPYPLMDEEKEAIARAQKFVPPATG
ncbi:MAG: DUF4446 family protein [Ardenticatenia bacterium]|nr:DUF4446 family protein [Ardenticatenia bacterium]